MKNGLYFENGELIYYVDDEPKHAGVVEVDGAIYYISSKGCAVRGEHIVHDEMTNGILKRGTYTFGDDYKLVKGSYKAPKKKKTAHKKSGRGKAQHKWLKEELMKVLKKKRNVAVIVGVLLFIIGVTGMSHYERYREFHHEGQGGVQDDAAKIVLPTFDGDVLLCSQAAKNEYDGELSLEQAIQTGNPYRAFFFEYQLQNASGKLYVSERSDLEGAQVYELVETADSVKIDNLKVDTTYYYSAVINDQKYQGSFHTAPGNRFVSIPGLVNTRDIGGYTTLDGKKVKQGLLIRGVEIDGLVNAAYYIPNDELENVQSQFGFVYDLDLREATIYSGQYTSRLNVPHKFYTAPQYGQIYTPWYRDSLRQIFKDLANPDNYPMYLHCTWGQDRTGTVIFLLQGILNISEEEMVREYRLTGYTNAAIATNNNMDIIINGLAPYAGNTVQEKIVSFLTGEIGVTMAEIESIREIFLEK